MGGVLQSKKYEAPELPHARDTLKSAPAMPVGPLAHLVGEELQEPAVRLRPCEPKAPVEFQARTRGQYGRRLESELALIVFVGPEVFQAARLST